MSESYFETFVQAIGRTHERFDVLGEEGIVYPPDEDFGYGATPTNAITFGNMGVDGVHYVILKLDGRIEDSSPVIQVAPMDTDAYSLLAHSFLEYLAIGCGVGLTEMNQVFEAERQGLAELVDFLRRHFDHSRIWDRVRDKAIDEYRDLLEIRP